MTFVIGIEVRAKDNASGPLGKVTGSLGRMLEVAGGNLLADVISGVGNSIADVGQQAFEAAGRFQVLEIGLETLISRQIVASGATDDYAVALLMAQSPAEGLLNWIKTIAVETPFTTESIADVARMGLAMKWTIPEVKDLAMAIGDFVAGMGLSDEHMQRIIYNFAQMVQQGKVTGTELRDLARGAFVPIEDVLIRMQENLGLTAMKFDDFRKAAALGKYPIDDFINAFIQISEEQFLGAMDRMALTWQTVTSNVKDFISAVLGAELLGPVVDKMSARVADSLQQLMTPEIRQNIQQIGQWIGITFERIATVLEEDVLPAIGRFFKTLGVEAPTLEGIGDAIGTIAGRAETLGDAFADFLDEAGPWLVEHGDTIKEVLLAIGVALLGFEVGTAIAGGIVALVTALALISFLGPVAIILSGISLAIVSLAVMVPLLALAWIRNWGDIQGKTKEVIDNIKQFLEDGIQGWKDAWENFKTLVIIIWDKIKEKISEIVESIKEFVLGHFENIKQGVIDAVEGMKSGVEGALTAIKDFFVGHFENIKQGVADAIDFIRTSILEPLILWLVGTFGPAFALIGLLFTSVFNLIVAVVEMFGAIFTLVMTAAAGLWQNILQPALQQMLMFWQMITAAVQILIDTALTALMEVFTNIATFLQETFGPIFTSVGEGVNKLAKTVKDVLIGAFNTFMGIAKGVAAFLSEKLKQAFVIIKGVVQSVAGVVSEKLTKAWNKLKATLKFVWATIKVGMGLIKGAFTNVLNKIKSLIENKVNKTIDEWKGKFDAIKGAVQAVIGIINSLIGKIKEFTRKLKNIDLGVFSPGSPTPFEMGLRGIADAMKDVNKLVTPTVGLGSFGGMSAGGVSGGFGAGSTTNYITIQVSGVGDPDAVANAIMHKLRLQGVKP